MEPFAFSRSVYSQAVKQYPYFSPRLPNGEWQTSSFYYGGGDNPEALIRNPFHYNDLWNGDEHIADLSVNMYADVKILNGLTYRISGSYSQGNFRRANYFGDKGEFQDEYFDPNLSLEESQSTSYNWNIDNTLRYKRTFGRHAFDVTAGFISQRFGDRFLTAGKDGFLSDITNTLNGPGGKNPYAEGGLQESALISGIAQAFYSFDDKYLFTVNFRRDGSSRFAKKYRWGNFPGVSVGWRLSNEDFWTNSNISKVISDLKIRGGYGVLGRQNLGNYDYTAVLDYVPVEFDGTVHDGLITGTPINEAISWERLISKTIGLDYELFGGKVSGSFDYYNNDTKDMIIGLELAPSVGGGELQSNAGLINNRGFEMTVNYNDKVGQFNYSVGFNLGTTRTKLLNIGRELVESESPEWDVPHVIELHRGGGLSEFWLIRTNGIFKSQEEIDNYTNSQGIVIQPDASPGDIRFVDANDDGEINPEGDRVLVGSGVPKVNLGFNFTANYKNFDFYLGATGAFGQVIYNAINYLVEQPYGFGNFSTKLLDAFDPVTNPNSNFPRLNPRDVDDNWNSRPTSDRYIENGSYLKIRNLEVGYQLPANLIQRVKISSVRVFGRVQNLATFSKYSGADPEVGSSPMPNDDPIYTAGLDRDTAPQARSFQVGVNISL
jgi:TonB-linked SusC/RagA family outer membrane protein